MIFQRSRDIGEVGETFMRSEISQVTAYSFVHPERYRSALYDKMASWMSIRCIVDDSNEALVKHILCTALKVMRVDDARIKAQRKFESDITAFTMSQRGNYGALVQENNLVLIDSSLIELFFG